MQGLFVFGIILLYVVKEQQGLMVWNFFIFFG